MTESLAGDVEQGSPVVRSGEADMRLVRERLAGLRGAHHLGGDLFRTRATAAFSRRDVLRPGYREALAAVSTRGFEPVIRPVGGTLAAYDEGSLVLHLWGSHASPRTHIRERFRLLGGAIVLALRGLGADARLGPIPGEYCDGAFSVNHAGRTKLAGTGQRITRDGYLFSAVVMVHSGEPVRAALTDGYAALGLTLDVRTVGGVADAVPGVTVRDVRRRLVDALRDLPSSPSLGDHDPSGPWTCP